MRLVGKELIMHTQLSSEIKGLVFVLSLHLLPYFACASSKGSGGTVRMSRSEHWPVAYGVGTQIKFVYSLAYSQCSCAEDYRVTNIKYVTISTHVLTLILESRHSTKCHQCRGTYRTSPGSKITMCGSAS